MQPEPWRRQVTAGRTEPRVGRTGDEADSKLMVSLASCFLFFLFSLACWSTYASPCPSQASSSHASARSGFMSRSGRDGDCDHSSVSRRGGNCHDGDYCDYKNIQNLLIIFVGYTRAPAGFGCMKFYNVNCRWHEESECSTSSAHKKNVIMRSVPIKLVH